MTRKDLSHKSTELGKSLICFQVDDDIEEKDPMQPDFDLDDVVEVLEEFNHRREERLNNQDMVANPALKKKQNFQTEEQKQER